jgi:valyl-tRNA synthetase
VGAEKARLAKELGKIEKEMASLQKKLDNSDFVQRAKPEVVSQARHRVEELTEKKAKVAATLRELDQAS